jgi:hypothetical protein
VSATLSAYKRHAWRFGPELVFESAEHELDAEGLAHLAVALVRSGWRPTQEQRDHLAVALIEAGWADQRILKLPTIGRNALARAHSKAANKRYSADQVLRDQGADRNGYCADCGGALDGRRRGARYCGTSCRVRAHRRHGEAA